MITIEQARTVIGQHMVGTSGDTIGQVGGIFLDDETGQPEWATVSGLSGARESFVPLAEADLSGGALAVPYTRDRVAGAPSVDADAALSQEEEATLYSYYGLAYSERASDSGLPATGGTATTATAAAPNATVSDAPLTVDRSEERLRVGVQRREAGRARLRKYVVTEQQTANVQVAHEELRVSREPITAGDPAARGATIGEQEAEVVLTAERAVVDKEVVPVERIRLDKQTVAETQQVSDSVRKEEVELIDTKGVRHDVDSDPSA